MLRVFYAAALLVFCSLRLLAQGSGASGVVTVTAENPYILLMQKATAHAEAHGAKVAPVLSPSDATVPPLAAGAAGEPRVPVAALQAMGVRVIPWTTNDPEKMRALIRMGVDGIISDRPDVLQAVLREERAAATGAVSEQERERLRHFDVAAHRGGRGLRPENTLPSFESGLDQLATTLETDTGVTTDHVSLIWHDQFLNPQSCRRADGSAYAMENRVYTRDISLAEAQRTFICDKLHFGPDQKNDLALSPVAVAFAARERMPSPYAPTYAAQLFRFVRFYAEYYRSGAGRKQPGAAERAANAETVRFNLETKILPTSAMVAAPSHAGEPKGPQPEVVANHTVEPQVFVDTLTGEVYAEHMETRSEIQSFDFRTLVLVEEQHPALPTYYLTEDAGLFSTDFVPAMLRLAPAAPTDKR